MKKKLIIIMIMFSLAGCLHIVNTERKNSLPEEQFAICNKKEIVVEKEEKIYNNNEIRTISAYNAGDINQCSGDPCISANGENVCELLKKGEKVCAANFVPFNTILEIEGYGKFRVIDRTSKKYGDRVDIAMKLSEKEKAREFGIKKLLISY